MPAIVQGLWRYENKALLVVESVFWLGETLHIVNKQLLQYDDEYSLRSSSITQLCPTLCDPMDCSTPGFPVHHQHPGLLKLMAIELVMPTISSSVVPFSSHLQSFPASWSFQMSQFFASGGQSIEFPLQHQPFH